MKPTPPPAQPATHTPGPWTAQRDCRNGGPLGEAWGIYGPETRIAVLETAQAWRPQERINADAALMAAAPAMLEALKQLAQETQKARKYIVVSDDNGFAVYNATAQALLLAGAAIANAEGRTP